ncbi:carboxylesterase/lipase family protein [Deinococcus aestuarii]|uniref:carboxylesterase/lipase family protein n=1 Tax=Deinococcus aestuarii TaxID=2774531 RepID=UPI001C0C947B|nr:carboxylesterase family protein [Deinococcus aestuarii]
MERRFPHVSSSPPSFSPRARRRRALLVTTLGLTLAACAGVTPPDALTVQTDRGAVRGVSAGGVESFRGIPYAAAPVGDLRWKAPQPAPAWSGVRPAGEFGNTCPALESTNGPRSETEDCLFINVQRPAGTSAGAGLPVYVFIHGGGLTNGSSNQADMDKIVRETGVIGVSLNYRLGVFGFLGHPGLTAEAGESGNFGFLDQQAALRWLQRNVAAFGGDPARVTVGGESAGGYSVCGHLVSPGSRGLLSKAMLQSPYCSSRTQAQADAGGTAFAARLGCTDPANVLACLRNASPAALLDASAGFSSLFVRGTSALPNDPREAVRTGNFARVPVVIGATRDEGRTFSQGNIGWTRAQYEAWVRETFGSNAGAVLAQYPWPQGADEYTGAELSGDILTDSGLIVGIGGCPTRTFVQDFARSTRTYAYEFAHRTGPGLVDRGEYEWGAGHAAELAYLFPSFNNGTPIAPLFDAAEQQLAREMVASWGSFTKSGSPEVTGQVPWPPHNEQGRTLSLRAGGQSVMIDDATYVAEHQCDFWNTLPAPTN